MPARKPTLGAHVDYHGTADAANGLEPRADQVITAAELVDLADTLRAHADDLDALKVHLQDNYMRILLEPDRASNATPIPQDLYALASITPGTRIQLQNQSHHMLYIFSGPSAPASDTDYFLLQPWHWATFESAALLAYSGIAGAAVVIQEGNDQLLEY